MTPDLKIDWFDLIRRGGIVLVALGLLGVVIWMKYDVDARADPYPGSAARERAVFVDSKFSASDLRMDNIEKQLAEMAKIQSEHLRSPMHGGSAERFAAIQVKLEYISATLTRIANQLEGR